MEKTQCGGVSEYLDAYYAILNTMKRRMTSAPLTGSVSHDFIVQMIPHHQAAVEMCKNLLRYPTGDTLERLAREIIAQQTRGVAEMERILCPCGRVYNGPNELCRYRGRNARILEEMFTAMAQASGVGVEENFLREMIPHHEGAIRMARNALSYRLCRPLPPILQNIIATQEREAAEMRRMLESLRSDQPEPCGERF